jgi:DNA-binding XRE family transcriptional regulator
MSYRPLSAAELKSFREERTLNQQDFADLVGVSKKALGAYELGRSPVPKTVGWACAAIAFNLPPMEGRL